MAPRGHMKFVLILRMADASYLVCDEYYPSDAGRIHILGDSMYAHFYSDSFTVEYKKAAIDVASIVYSSNAGWPTRIAGSRDRAEILRHFNCNE